MVRAHFPKIHPMTLEFFVSAKYHIFDFLLTSLSPIMDLKPLDSGIYTKHMVHSKFVSIVHTL